MKLKRSVYTTGLFISFLIVEQVMVILIFMLIKSTFY